MKPQIVVVAFLSSLVAFFLCGLVADVVAAPADAGVALVAPFDAGPQLAPVPDVGSGSAVAVPVAAPLPDPLVAPVESASLVVRLWKGGAIPASLIVGVFMILSVLSRKFAALQRGHVALAIAALLGGLTILLEPASRGTTPTLPMVWAAVIAAVALFLKGQPSPPAPKTA